MKSLYMQYSYSPVPSLSLLGELNYLSCYPLPSSHCSNHLLRIFSSFSTFNRWSHCHWSYLQIARPDGGCCSYCSSSSSGDCLSNVQIAERWRENLFNGELIYNDIHKWLKTLYILATECNPHISLQEMQRTS